MTRIVLLVFVLSLLGWSAAGPCAEASEELPVPLMEGKPYLDVFHDGRSVRIQRVQDPDHELKGYFAKTARNCPPFCIHAMKVADGVVTVGELEMFEFMKARMRDGTGILNRRPHAGVVQQADDFRIGQLSIHGPYQAP